jgi:hypothetical protein
MIKNNLVQVTVNINILNSTKSKRFSLFTAMFSLYHLALFLSGMM